MQIESFDPGRLIVAGQLRDGSSEPLRLQADDGSRRYHFVRHGVCVESSEWQELSPDAQYAAFVHATALMARGEPHIFSHQSAAAIWRMPLIDPWPRKAHVSVRPDRAHSSGLIIRHPEESIAWVERDGLRVTTASRTVADLAAAEGLLTGLAAADRAIREGWCERQHLHDEWQRLTPRAPGRATIRRVAELASPLAESPGESLSRGQLFLLRFPEPQLQAGLHDVNGPIGVVDFKWPGLVGEFDGQVKYGMAYANSPDEMRERLVAEKAREDRIRAVGERVARWGWQDAYRGAPMAAVLESQGLRPRSRRIWVRVPAAKPDSSRTN